MLRLDNVREELREIDPGVLAEAEKLIAAHGLNDRQAAKLIFGARLALDSGVDRYTVIGVLPQDVQWIIERLSED